MITCKKDLINTYIYDDGGELRDAYFSIAEKFGFLIDEGDYNLGIISVMNDCKYVQDISSVELVRKCKKLTLSDLKPRTKVGYIICKPIPGDEVHLAHENKSIRQSDALYLFIGESLDGKGVFQHLVSKNIFEESLHLAREKKERPVEWWEDAVEYIRSLNGEANAIDFTDASSDGKKMAMNISVVLDERQAKDFAKILLEQEGE